MGKLWTRHPNHVGSCASIQSHDMLNIWSCTGTSKRGSITQLSRRVLLVRVRYGAFLSYTLYIADCSTDHETEKGNEYSLEADSKELRHGESMQDIGPTPNGTSRSAAMAPKQFHISISISDSRRNYTLIIVRSLYSKSKNEALVGRR